MLPWRGGDLLASTGLVGTHRLRVRSLHACSMRASRAPMIVRMRSLASAIVLSGAVALFGAPAHVLAEPPPTSVATTDSPSAAEATPPGQSVTLTGPFEDPKPKKRSKPVTRTKDPAKTTPPRSHSVPPVATARSSTPSSQDGAVRVVRKARPSVRGGLARRVAVRPAARGGRSTEELVPAAPQAAPPVLPAGVAAPAAKSGDSTNRALVLLAAVAALEVLLGMGFAYRRWSRRRVVRLAARAAEGVEEAPEAPRAIVPREGSAGRLPATRRWRP